MIRTFLLSLILLLCSFPVQAQELPRFMVGQWQGDGDGAWGAFEHTLKVTPVLNGRALEFQMEHKRGVKVYKIRGLAIEDAAGNLKASWFDQDGIIVHYKVEVGPKQLTLRSEYGTDKVNIRRWKLRPNGTLRYKFSDGPKDSIKTLNQAVLSKST